MSTGLEGNWNLLDDPNLLKEEEEEEEEPHCSNILEFSEKEIKGNSAKQLGAAESSIRPKAKPSSSACYKIAEEDDDLKDLYEEFLKPSTVSNPKKKWWPSHPYTLCTI